MRILQVITGIPRAAGTSVFCGELANGLVKLGHEVSVAVVDPAAANSYHLDHRIALISISSLLDHGAPRPDIVHIHALWAPILHKVIGWTKENRIPVVWSPHGMLTSWAMNNKRWKKRLGWCLYQKRDLRSAALLHATAQSEVDDIRRMGLTNRVVIAPLGVHLKPLGHEVSRPSNVRTLLFVSRVQRKKGLPMLLNVLSKIKTSRPDLFHQWKLRIVGPDQEGHVAELKDQCNRLGLTYTDEASQSPAFNLQPSTSSGSPGEVVFAGSRFGDELDREYASADLFVLPTHSENFGSVVIESLAHGVPVICTKGAPWEELEGRLENGCRIGECGRWVDIDESAIEAALVEMMEMADETRKTMGVNGRKLVAERYTWDSVSRLLETDYRKLVSL